MRDRLIELICDKLQNGCECYCNHPPCSQCKDLADYLLENGVVVLNKENNSVENMIELLKAQIAVLEGWGVRKE